MIMVIIIIIIMITLLLIMIIIILMIIIIIIIILIIVIQGLGDQGRLARPTASSPSRSSPAARRWRSAADAADRPEQYLLHRYNICMYTMCVYIYIYIYILSMLYNVLHTVGPEGTNRATSVNVRLPRPRKGLRTGSISRDIVNFPSELCRHGSGMFA